MDSNSIREITIKLYNLYIYQLIHIFNAYVQDFKILEVY